MIHSSRDSRILKEDLVSKYKESSGRGETNKDESTRPLGSRGWINEIFDAMEELRGLLEQIWAKDPTQSPKRRWNAMVATEREKLGEMNNFIVQTGEEVTEIDRRIK